MPRYRRSAHVRSGEEGDKKGPPCVCVIELVSIEILSVITRNLDRAQHVGALLLAGPVQLRSEHARHMVCRDWVKTHMDVAWCAWTGVTEFVRAALEACGDRPCQEALDKALALCGTTGNYAMASLLLHRCGRREEDTSLCTSAGCMTALMRASTYGHVSVVQLMCLHLSVLRHAAVSVTTTPLPPDDLRNSVGICRWLSTCCRWAALNGNHLVLSCLLRYYIRHMFFRDDDEEQQDNILDAMRCAAAKGHVRSLSILCAFVVLFLRQTAGQHQDHTVTMTVDRAALRVACYNRQYGAARLLLDVFQPDTLACSQALCISVKREHLGLCDLLLERGADVNFADGEPLCWAAGNACESVVHLLLDSPAVNVNERGGLALRWASANGRTEVVMRLLDAGASIEAGNHKALRWACMHGRTEVARLLMQRGSDIQAENMCVLHWCCHDGHMEILDLVLATQPHLGHDHLMRCLFWGIQKGNARIVCRLLEYHRLRQQHEQPQQQQPEAEEAAMKMALQCGNTEMMDAICSTVFEFFSCSPIST